MKKMVDNLIYEVRSEKEAANISHVIAKKNPIKKETHKSTGIFSEKCPKCQKGKIIKGKTAYGCNEFKSGCNFRLPFKIMDKKISEKQYIRLIQKGCTVNLKGFKTETGKVEGLIRFDEGFILKFEPKNSSITKIPDKITCPKCKKGTILKGKTAYGCSEYKNGCDYIFTFEAIKKKAASKTLTKELVYQIINGAY